MTDPLTPAERPEPDPMDPYDAVVLLSFGGPESPEEVMPFLRRVTAGRGIPEERLAEVASHYHARGGVSPINGQNRALLASLETALREAGSDIVVRLANRNSAPFVPATLAELYAEGARRIVVVTTSGYSSYSSCRQYRENLADAVAEIAVDDLVVDRTEGWFGHPGFIDTQVRLARSMLLTRAASPGGRTHVLFVTHSIPEWMDQTSGPGDEEGSAYSRQHEAVAAAIIAALRADATDDLDADLVFCSRSGPPNQPWLEPDVGDRIRELAQTGCSDILLVPIGFVSDHMEVLNDLDTVAVAVGAEHGVRVHRVATVGTDPTFVAGLVDLLTARAALARGEARQADFVLSVPRTEPICPAGCCPNVRAARPALGGVAP